LSWQVVPSDLTHMLTDGDRSRAERVLTAVMRMKKFDVAALRRAYAGIE
jgi:predicted 3-demethylubiquinone-9 3-methyltransferase (glyoxalase superfamily)